MEQRQLMQDLITDKELTLACDLTTKVEPYQLSLRLRGFGSQPGLLWDSRNSSVYYLGNPVKIESLFQLHHAHGWKIVTAAHWENIDRSNGYMGVILVHESKGLMLLAHRGMQTDSIPNIANCLNIALDRYVPISRDAINMCQVALNLIGTRYQGFTLCHTGFSMGGFLAQITASACHHVCGDHNQAICYDSPGADHAMNQLQWRDNRSNIIIYLTSPNLVNTGKPHYGDVRQIAQWRNKNEYETTYRTLAVDNPFNFVVNNLVNNQNKAFVTSSVNSHLHLFNETHSPFNAQNNFDFHCVQTWPMATNIFTYRQVGNTQPNIINPTNFEELLINIGNLIAENTVQKIAFEAGLPKIESVTHQIVNPQIILSEVPFLHGNSAPVSPSPAIENTTPIYSSPFATVPVSSQNNDEIPTRSLNHFPRPC